MYYILIYRLLLDKPYSVHEQTLTQICGRRIVVYIFEVCGLFFRHKTKKNPKNIEETKNKNNSIVCVPHA